MTFLQPFYKRAQDEVINGRKQVAALAVIHKGKILLGKRRDNNLHTNPGGHIDKGERPLDAAMRELREEAGMTAKSITPLEKRDVTTHTGKKYTIHAFKVLVNSPSTTMKEDPDQEVERWQWYNMDGGLPEHVMNNLHSPDNVVLQNLGLQAMKKCANRNWKRSFQRAAAHNKKDGTKNRAFEIKYQKLNKEKVKRIVEPLSFKGNTMVAFDRHRGAVRSFKLDRMKDMKKSAFWKSFEKRALSDYIAKKNLEAGAGFRGDPAKKSKMKQLRGAERALVKNQLSKIKTDTPVGAGVGALAGGALSKKRLLGAGLGALAGGLGGFISGTARGSRGSDAAKLRKKHLGTSDLKKIRKKYFQKKNK